MKFGVQLVRGTEKNMIYLSTLINVNKLVNENK